LLTFHQRPSDWTTPQAYTPPGQGPHPAKKVATSPNPGRPPIPSWASQGSSIGTANTSPTPGRTVSSSSGRQNSNPAAPIHLPLSDHDDERSPSRSVEIQSPQFGKLGTSGAAPGGTGSGAVAPGAVGGAGITATGQSAMEEEDLDLLYEYFPLSLEDW
jgi:hypothetical protein